MSRVVQQYAFHVHGVAVIEMPEGATIHPFVAAAPDELLVVWAEVDPDQQRTEDRVLHVVATGEALPERPVRYLGTAATSAGVAHVYESIPEDMP